MSNTSSNAGRIITKQKVSSSSIQDGIYTLRRAHNHSTHQRGVERVVGRRVGRGVEREVEKRGRSTDGIRRGVKEWWDDGWEEG